MASNKEKEEMRKALAKVDNKWEFLAYVYTFRTKEIFKTISAIEAVIIVILLMKYTELFETILNFIYGLFT